jgi:hypothetical protein
MVTCTALLYSLALGFSIWMTSPILKDGFDQTVRLMRPVSSSIWPLQNCLVWPSFWNERSPSEWTRATMRMPRTPGLTAEICLVTRGAPWMAFVLLTTFVLSPKVSSWTPWNSLT